MNIVGMQVTHKKFGLGEVVAIMENKMDVDFKFGIKTFLYPDAFEQYFMIKDTKMQSYINEKLTDLNEKKNFHKEQIKKRAQASAYSRKVRKRVNSQAVFALQDNCFEDVLNQWSLYTGIQMSGKGKGKPRIPKNMNINSSCLMTIKSKGEGERERSIVGIFMVPEDFIGEGCVSGVIPAHEKYRVLWDENHEKLSFWDYFPEETKQERWGNSELKYLPVTVVKKVLEDMVKFAQEEDEREELVDFYQYYCDMNQL